MVKYAQIIRFRALAISFLEGIEKDFLHNTRVRLVH
jgi:hypothetical protein